MVFKSRKMQIAVLALILSLVFSLSACGGSKGDNVLRIGTDDTYPPMEFIDDKNVTVGFDIDFATEVAKRMGKKAEIISNDWAGIFRALETDKFDCIVSATSITPDRLEDYALTDPYVANAQVIVVKIDDTSINEPKDLKGKKVGVQIETTADESAQKYQKETFFDLKQYDQVIQPFQDMKAGRLDAIIVDEVVARYYVKLDKDSYKVAGGRLTNEPIAICFTKENSNLRDKANEIIKEMREDGTLKQLSEKWFGEDLTSNVEG